MENFAHNFGGDAASGSRIRAERELAARRPVWRHHRLLLLLFLFPVSASAQYYDWGQDPATTRWSIIKTAGTDKADKGGFRVIYPRGSERQAARYVNLIDALKTPVSFGFDKLPLRRTPVVLHTQNFQANGMVMMAPRRVELLTAPTSKPMSTLPWHKELVAHELRHAVQFNNFNRGVPRVLSWVLGEQVLLTAPLYMPLWAMEGDAVMAESMMTGWGRGLQPSFSIEYRAMLAEGVPRFGRRARTNKPWTRLAIDKYFCGSFRDHMPDHYRVGYQIMSWAWGEYGEVFLNKTTRFAARNPYMIAPFAIGLRKFYGTSTNRMFRSAFTELEQYWREEAKVENSSKIIETPLTSHTRYESPRWVDGYIVALKTDLDRTTRLVQVDEKGNERTLCRTGSVNSPLTLHDGRIYWAETRQSVLWEQKVGSVICYYDLRTNRHGVLRETRNAMFPTSSQKGLAWVEYHDGRFEFVYPEKEGHKRFAVADSVSIHGLAAVDNFLYYIGMDDSGMWIGDVDRHGTQKRVTEPTGALLADLSSMPGQLLYTSSASGKDEAWALDHFTRENKRITNSRYGSFSPIFSPNGFVMTTYTPRGWLLATQQMMPSDSVLKALQKPLPDRPQERLNPPRPRWDVPNLDTVTVPVKTEHPAKKYRKGLHLFNFHSWAPIYFEPDKVVSEVRLDDALGITLMSQNALANAYTEVGFGRVSDGNKHYNVAHAKFKWLGWAPKIELSASWADTPQLVYNAWTRAMVSNLRDHMQLNGFVYLPLTLSSGAWIRYLTPSVQWQHTNARLYETLSESYKTGMDFASAAVQYSSGWRLAHRDFAPRWGWSARASHTWSPTSSDFGRIWTVRGRIYAPGVARHHSLQLQGAMQWQKAKRYSMQQKVLYPRGVAYNGISARRYRSVSIDYALPVAYPDWGINSLLYISRIRIAPGYDVARIEGFNGAGWRTVSSWGADLTFDFTLLRMPSANVQEAIFSVRKPSDRSGAWLSFGINVAL